MNEKKNPSQEEVREAFDYLETGALVWKTRKNGVNAYEGKIAGCVNNVGYVVIRLQDSLYTAHRLIWIYHNGNISRGLVIDHINGIKTDNQVSNLRLVTQVENSINKRAVPSNNTSGYLGVYFDDTAKNKWMAAIRLKGKQVHIGRFSTKLEAAIAFNNMVVKHRSPPYYLNPIP